MSTIYTDPPQSRNEAIIKSTIDGTQYTDPPQSRMEDLLLDLKEAIEGGGGGGTTVVANPEGEATDELEKLQVGSDIYGIPKDYEEMSNKPSINSVELSGNKTASDLGLQTELKGTQTVSGNPITVTDAEAMNAESVVVELEPKQDLHGYDAPWVGGAGKNKLEVTATTQTINGITFTVNSDGTVIANGTATAEADFLMSVSNIQGSYIVNGCPIGGSASTYYLGVETTVSSWNNRDFGNGVTINDDTIIRVAIVIIGGYTANNLLFKPMIRLATETDPTFEPYSNICPITGYSEVNVERVGKNLVNTNTLDIFNNGHYFCTPDFSSQAGASVKGNTQYVLSCLNGWTPSLSAGQDITIYFWDNKGNAIGNTQENPFTTPNGCAGISFYCGYGDKIFTDGASVLAQLELGNQATTYEPYQGNTYTIDLDGTKYGGILDVTSGVLNVTHGEIASYDGETLPSTWISDRDEYEAGTTPTTGAQVVYKLATPTSVSTTPTDIELLENTNNISTDGTNITLKYQPNNVIGECKAYTDEQIEKIATLKNATLLDTVTTFDATTDHTYDLSEYRKILFVILGNYSDASNKFHALASYDKIELDLVRADTSNKSDNIAPSVVIQANVNTLGGAYAFLEMYLMSTTDTFRYVKSADVWDITQVKVYGLI